MVVRRWKKVSPEGVYTAPNRSMEKMGYAPMVGIRAHIVIGAADVLGRACTVAIRYSAVRKQFADDEGMLSRSCDIMIDSNQTPRRGRTTGVGLSDAAVSVQSCSYSGVAMGCADIQTLRYRLFPLLATVFAGHFTAKYMHNLYDSFVKGLESADVSVLPEVSSSSLILACCITG
jgi:acyl-CoA oxidase